MSNYCGDPSLADYSDSSFVSTSMVIFILGGLAFYELGRELVELLLAF
jgi:hypothetical protein